METKKRSHCGGTLVLRLLSNVRRMHSDALKRWTRAEEGAKRRAPTTSGEVVVELAHGSFGWEIGPRRLVKRGRKPCGFL